MFILYRKRSSLDVFQSQLPDIYAQIGHYSNNYKQNCMFSVYIHTYNTKNHNRRSQAISLPKECMFSMYETFKEIKHQLQELPEHYKLLAAQERERLRFKLAIEVRKMRDSGMSISKIAEMYGTKDRKTIYDLLKITEQPKIDQTLTTPMSYDGWMFKGEGIFWAGDMWMSQNLKTVASPEFVQYIHEHKGELE